jgi:hypothetical protein
MKFTVLNINKMPFYIPRTDVGISNQYLAQL